jgi:hypothetical protein
MTPAAERWLASPRAPWIAVAAGLLLALPSLAGGIFADDDLLLLFLQHKTPYAPAWYDLYHFVPDGPARVADVVARGQFPWWAAPTLHLHFVRPLSSALVALDYALFAQAPLGYHVHSILWWMLALVAVGVVYRRILRPATAAIALLLFAVADAHALTYAWIASRHALVSAAPAFFALAAAIRAREEQWAPGRWLAPLGMGVALLGGESALGALALWASFEALGPRAPDGWIAKLRGAAMPMALGIAYLGVYALVGGGTHASGGYVVPTSAEAIVLMVSKRLPGLFAAALVDFPSELSTLLPAWPFVVVAVVAGVAVALLWRAARPLIEPRERAAVRWLIPGACLAMLGNSGGFPGGRLLFVANLAWCALFAVLLRHGLRRGEQALVYRRVVTGVLLVIHVVAAPLLAVQMTRGLAQAEHAIEVVAKAPALNALPAPREIFFVQASDPSSSSYPIAHLTRTGAPSAPSCATTLSGSTHGVRVTRTGPASLTLATPTGAFNEAPFETMFRASSIRFAVGDAVKACSARVTVLDVDGDGRPTRIEARFDEPLDDPAIRLVAWKDGAVKPVRLAVGATTDLAWSPGPIGL